MCGFVGFLDGSHSVDAGWLGRTVQSMADVLRHRGPDDDGVWVHAGAGGHPP